MVVNYYKRNGRFYVNNANSSQSGKKAVLKPLVEATFVESTMKREKIKKHMIWWVWPTK